MSNLLSSVAKLAARLGEKCFSPPKAADALPQNPQRILWIRLDHIGDGVMNLPAMAALRSRFPNARIDALVSPSFAPLLDSLHLVDHIFLGNSPRFPLQDGTAGRWKAAMSMRKFAVKQRGKYDLAIDARGDDVARLAAFWSKTPYRLGPDRISDERQDAANFSFLMTHLTHLSDQPRHAVMTNLAHLQPLGVTEVPFSWPITSEQKASVQHFLNHLKLDGAFAVMQTRSNDRLRDWSAQGFAAVADYLVSQYGLKVLLCGAAVDVPYNIQIMRLAEHSLQMHNLAGDLSLTELPILLQKARLMVTVDTGPMHLGAMVKVPIVALMLPDLALRHFPWKQPNAAVTALDGKMKNVSLNAVIRKIDAVLLEQEG